MARVSLLQRRLSSETTVEPVRCGRWQLRSCYKRWGLENQPILSYRILSVLLWFAVSQYRILETKDKNDESYVHVLVPRKID
ncbi:Nucleoporin NDC1 [Fusarium oxysporum f. sp. albedinis]|nr:Nucleoporin NDC1 [Fusarium oxysporum f. sp. albedinis]